MNRWVNFLALLPGTSLTLLVISIAFLRVYDETDFLFLGYLANARLWSNRLTMAALLVALANFGVEWDRRNQETDRRTEEEQRRVEERQRRVEEGQRRAEEEQRRAEETERAARRTRIQNRWIVLQARYLLSPTAEIEATIADFVQFLQEYGEL